MLHQPYIDLLNDKRVAVVGGASHDPLDPRLVDADLVVRCNNHVGKGERCDVLYTSGGAAVREWVKEGLEAKLKFLWCYMHEPGSQEIMQWAISHGIPGCYYGARPEWHKLGHFPECLWPDLLGQKIEAFPLTGTLAAFHVLLHPVKSLYITGFDFYRRDDGTHPVHMGPHFLRPCMKYVSGLVGDDRVDMDDVLLSVLPAADDPLRFTFA